MRYAPRILARDEARRIANIAKLAELLRLRSTSSLPE
jgi:hypothetical protein